METSNALCVWRFTDGKPGHEKQTQALCEGLQAFKACNLHSINVHTLQHTAKALLIGHWPELAEHWPELDPLDRPDIVVGAGHKTHLPLLAAKRCFGAKAVVIMNPSLPASFFDAVITPAHDGYQERGHRLVTPTALAPSLNNNPEASAGLILVGGENNHFTWDEQQLCNYIIEISRQRPDIHWDLTNSRRTPKSTTSLLQEICIKQANLSFFDVETVDSNWLPDKLCRASVVWITSDSASMLAESLNSSASVGTILLPSSKPAKNNKLLKSVKGLIESKEIGCISKQGLVSPAPRSNPANFHYSLAQKLLSLLGVENNA